MSVEVELKILNINPDEVREKLKELGIETTRIDQKDFVLLLSEREVLRIREVNGKVKLTYKFRIEKSKFKVARETEVLISDFENMRKILERICKGVPYYQYVKRREVFEIDGVKGEIVELDGLQPFIELEGERGKILEVIKKLGLENHETSSEGIPSLLKRAGIFPKILGGE